MRTIRGKKNRHRSKEGSRRKATEDAEIREESRTGRTTLNHEKETITHFEPREILVKAYWAKSTRWNEVDEIGGTGKIDETGEIGEIGEIDETEETGEAGEAGEAGEIDKTEETGKTDANHK
ncbi:hypothetical protein EX30DRAFT_374773 [Ascodesmis nigricans]|uniref:Uncharacterized protein n=1 Tax=Ascodesmis nigricans TaxID=341454 RepID=A0A4S2MPL0_9PEZI|nr:hypothetical protein EX30DRAFT_374773 [Ascodesmis nigricans]